MKSVVDLAYKVLINDYNKENSKSNLELAQSTHLNLCNNNNSVNN